ncbi:TSUP family transporter [Ignatzschineria cameli]|uniref:TSUP family transporter n=1 Tax=Ignatzschineria cameli TaxID=2182793 RepID=UPI001EFDF6B7|nr:TSUP family transporter [Ignatzschineria cameli]
MAGELFLVLMLVAMVAGFIDAIAGGGGLITLPALLLAGLSPVQALATNKLQSSAGSFSATFAFFRQGLIQWHHSKWVFFLALAGGMVGALLATRLPATFLQIIVPILLLSVAVYFLFSPNLDGRERRAKISRTLFLLTFVPLIGFYDGIFGPGTGSFFMVAFVLLLGSTLVNAIAETKLANFASNIGSLLIFAFSGEMQVLLGLLMALGAFIGAQLGALFAVKYGGRVIRPLLIVMSVGMAIKLLLEPSNPLSLWILSLWG